MKKARNNNDIRIASQNVRGLKTNDKINELSATITQRGYFAVCLQETWRSGAESIDHKGNRFLFNGLEKHQHQSRRGEQGVAIVLNQDALAAWKAAGSVVYNEFGARIIAIRLTTKCNSIFLISAYAPVGVADEYLWEDFLINLETCISKKHRDDILIIGCDSNSSMGVSQLIENERKFDMNSIGKFGLSHRNNAGIRFSTYLETNSLVALTTYFRKKSYRTWTHPRSKLQHQIDHFITSKNSFNRFVDAGVMTPFIDSDHRAVFVKLRIRHNFVKRLTRRQRVARLDQNVLLSPQIKNLFCHRVNDLYRESDEIDSYSKLEKAMELAALTTLPKTFRPQPGWFSSNQARLNRLIEERNIAVALKIKRPTRNSAQRLRKARKELKAEIARSKNNWILNICEDINNPVSASKIH